MDSGTHSAGRNVFRTTDLRLHSQHVNFPPLYKSCCSLGYTKSDSTTDFDLQLRQALDTDVSPWLEYVLFSVKPPDAAPLAQSGKVASVLHWTQKIPGLDQDMSTATPFRFHYFTWCWNSVWLLVKLTLPSALSASSSRSRNVALSTNR